MKTLKRIGICTIFLLIFISAKSNVYASMERIQNYVSDIYIQEDSTMILEEMIKVYADGNEIKRGIYRDFLTEYTDKYDNINNMNLKVLKVLKDGEEEIYNIEKQNNGIRIYIGDSNKLLDEGTYTYTIKYEIKNYLENVSELYWNVTGNGWTFQINNAKAIVHFPESIDINKITYDAYTGKNGEKGTAYLKFKSEEYNYVGFQTQKTLKAGEGMTIIVGLEEQDEKTVQINNNFSKQNMVFKGKMVIKIIEIISFAMITLGLMFFL